MEQKTKKPISKSLIKRLHIIYSAQGIDDEQKRAILLDLTDGRTNTTKELTYSEAMYLCGYLNGAKKENRDLTITEREIRRRRSAVLKRVQRIGIDTTDWGAVNAFCLDSRKEVPRTGRGRTSPVDTEAGINIKEERRWRVLVRNNTG